MPCPQCGAENREGARFCRACGELLPQRCPQCGTVRPEPARFCDQCGAPPAGPDVGRFLRHLLARLPGKLLVIWDGSPIHRGQPVKDFLARGGARRLRPEPLPGYAPNLNPLDQGIWHHLKHDKRANVCCTDPRHLRQELRQAVARPRHKRHTIQGAIRHARYQL